jgi:hypothetical protein
MANRRTLKCLRSMPMATSTFENRHSAICGSLLNSPRTVTSSAIWRQAPVPSNRIPPRRTHTSLRYWCMNGRLWDHCLGRIDPMTDAIAPRCRYRPRRRWTPTSDPGPRPPDPGPRTPDLGPRISDLGPRISALGSPAASREGGEIAIFSYCHSSHNLLPSSRHLV